MSRLSLLALFASPLILSACTSAPPAAGVYVPEVVPEHRNGQLDFTLGSGTYDCEYGQRVDIQREVHARINHLIHLGWNGKTYRLERDPSHSGLPRFEDAASGLVWIDLPWKGLLLEGKTHKPLANECRLS